MGWETPGGDIGGGGGGDLAEAGGEWDIGENGELVREDDGGESAGAKSLKAEQLASNQAQGAAYEKSIEEETGFEKNTTPITLDGKSGVPDFNEPDVVIEAKSGIRVGGTKALNQIKLYAQYASQEQKAFQIWTTPDTTFSARISAFLELNPQISVIRW